MIVEMRMYTTHTGMTGEFVALYKDEGLPIQEAVQGKPMAVYTHEVGPLEQVILLWRFESLADRQARRAKLRELPEWKTFLAKAAPLVASHENRILNPA